MEAPIAKRNLYILTQSIVSERIAWSQKHCIKDGNMFDIYICWAK